MSHICRELLNSTRDLCLAEIYSALVAAGWVEHYVASSTDKVYKSNGKNDNLPPVYLRIWAYSTNYISFESFQHWSGSVGVCTLCGQTSIINFTNFRIYCNKHYIYIPYYNFTSSSFFFYMVESPYRLVKTVQQAVVGGSSVVIYLDNVDNLRIGQYKNIYGITGEGQREIQITNIDKVNKTITVTGCSSNFPSGSLVGDYITNVSSPYLGNLVNAFAYNKIGTAILPSNNITIIGKYSDVGAQYAHDNMVAMEPAAMRDAYRYYGEIDSTFIKCTKGVSPNDLIVINNPNEDIVDSLVTSFTDYSITDTSRTFVPDSLIGKVVVFISGTGSGFTRYIVGNTENTITFRVKIPTITTSTGYRVVEEVYRVCHNSYNSHLNIKEEF